MAKIAEIAEIVLIGGGGHARMLIECLRAASDTRSLCILDSDRARIGTELDGVRIVGDDAFLDELVRGGTRGFAVAVGGTRDNGPRSRIFERAIGLGLEPVTIVHPRAIVAGNTSIGGGCQILPGAIVNPGSVLGRNVIVNSGAIVEHDCTIGDHVHIASGACLASTVSVARLAHIGSGAIVRQVLSIGAAAVVGAGAVVVKDVAAMTVVVGVPAKELHP